MSIKILGGKAKGLSLLVPKGQLIRPTSVMLRRKIFDANQNLNDWVFADFCAGSGAIGIEALSRGAVELYSIEEDSVVYKLLQKNLASAEERIGALSDSLHIKSINWDATRWLVKFQEVYNSWTDEKKAQTIIFLDPPYGNIKIYKSFIEALYEKKNWFFGEFWLESDNLKGIHQEDISELLKSYGQLKLYKHSQSYIISLTR